MRQLLVGQKKAFKLVDVKRVVVPRQAWLTVTSVIKMIVDNPGMLMYLPDKEDLKPESVSRSFLFDTINTLDPTFFPDALAEIDHL